MTEPRSLSFSAEGVLREALMKLWEQARKAKVEKIGLLNIKGFDPNDAFRLIGAVSSIQSAVENG